MRLPHLGDLRLTSGVTARSDWLEEKVIVRRVSAEPGMSVAPSLRAAARSAYHDLLRASASTFAGTSLQLS